METKETLKWLSERFGIAESEILWYNSGISYSRIAVKSIEAANKVRACVAGETVNGGMLHGMPLGGISEMKVTKSEMVNRKATTKEDRETGEIYFDVTC